MKHFKKATLLVVIFFLTFALSACGNKNEFESVRSFEFNFSHEEYEEEYNEIKKDIELENNVNYQINIDSFCKIGTIIIQATYVTSDNETKVVDMTELGHHTITIRKGTTDCITFSITIGSETEGNVKVDILSDKV